MGGFGSGRSGSGRAVIESTRCVDIRYLNKQGYLRSGSSGSLYWRVGDRPDGDIRFQTQSDHIRFIFRVREGGGDWESVEQQVSFDRTPCHFGGERTWFLCTGCERRVGVVSGYGRLFLCRHCYRLPYASQRESELDRMFRAKRKIENTMYGGDVAAQRKAKGMHWATYNRLFDHWAGLEAGSLRGMAARVGLL